MNPDQSQREAHNLSLFQQERDRHANPTKIKSTPASPDDDEGFDDIISRVELDTDTIADLCSAMRYAFQHLPPLHQDALRAQLKGAGL